MIAVSDITASPPQREREPNVLLDESFRVLDWNAPGGAPAFRMRQLRLRVPSSGDGDAARAFLRDVTLLETPEGRRWAVEHVTLPPGPVQGDQPFERVASSAGGRAELWYVPDARQPHQVADPMQASRASVGESPGCGGAWLRLTGGGRGLLLDGGELGSRSVTRLVSQVRAAAFRAEEVEDLFRLVRLERYPESAGTGDSFLLPRLLLRDRLPMPAATRSLYREAEAGEPLALAGFRALADLGGLR
jgi:hypothetical protein